MGDKAKRIMGSSDSLKKSADDLSGHDAQAEEQALARTRIPFLAFGLGLGVSSTFGQTYFFGVLQPFIRQDYGWSEADFGRIYLLVTLASAVGLAFLGRWIDRLPLPRYALILSLAMGASVMLASVAYPVFLLVIAMMAMRLVGQGLMVHAAMTSMSRYFETMRGCAIAIAGAGIPIGQAIIPPLAVVLIADIGWRDTLFWFGLIFLAVGVPLLQIMLRGHHVRHARWLRIEQEHEQALPANLSGTTGNKQTQPPAPAKIVIPKRRGDMLRDWRFYLVAPAVLSLPFWVTAFFFFADRLADYRSVTLVDLTAVYWIFAVGGALVPIAAGVLVDRLGGRVLLSVPPLLLLVAMIVVQLPDNDLAIPLYMIVLGTAGGVAVPINNALWAELYGTRHLGEIKALVNALVVVSTALAPMLVGEVMALGVSFNQLIGFAIIHCVIAAPLAFLVSISATAKAAKTY